MPARHPRSRLLTGFGLVLAAAAMLLIPAIPAAAADSSLEVDKYWVINGGTPVQEGSEPAHLGLGAQLTVNGGNLPWNTSITGFLEGAGVTLNESVTFGNPLCGWTGEDHGLVSEDNGQAPANGSLPYSDILGGGSNHYTITNTVTCDSTLTLVKDVLNGPALASAWTLSATPVDSGDVAFASGSTGVSHPASADSAYQLDENAADGRYNQVGPWTCTQFGSVTTVSGEQQVSVEAGRAATCTVENATAVLVLRKVVQDPNGGTALPGDFTLVASPQSGGADLSTPGSGAGTSFFVDPDEVFVLSETGGPFGYALTGINCGNGPVTSVQVPISTTVTCTYTNVDSSLTLDKIVDANGTGDTTPETAWHLSATPLNIANQPTIEGDGGATGATKAGTYQLAESGPATHTAGTWTCKDDADNPVTVSAIDQITLAASQIVFCEITNTAITPQLTLIKRVDPGNTGDETGPDAFTLFAIPDGIVGQPTVSGPGPQVDADVMVGLYTLDEEGPSTYVMDAAGWTCTDDADNPVPVSASDQFSIGLGEHITCEVTNNAVPSSWMVAKSSDPVSGSTVNPGDQIEYTVTVTKVGDGVNVENIDVTDTLTGIDMSWVSGISASDGTATPGAGVINWHIDEVSDTVTLTYTVTIGQVFGATLKNVVTPGPTPCVDLVPDTPNILDCDETTHFTAHFVLDKSVSYDDVDGDGKAEPGQTLTYKLTMTNDTTNATVTNAVVDDDVSDVLDNGIVVETPAELAAKGLVVTGDTLTWTVASLAPGATIEVTYQVLIGADQWGETLHNVATPEPQGPGECAGEGDCETDTETPPVNNPPVVIVPPNISIHATGAAGAFVTFTATATDVEDGALAPVCTPASGSTFAIGTSTVTCTAVDSNENVAAPASFTVTVANNPPVLTVPANMTASATSAAGAVVTFTATATDVEDGTAPVVCTPASGSALSIGVTTVNCAATDSAGATDSDSFVVTVVNTPPVISTPPSVTAAATSASGAIVTYIATAADAQQGAVTVTCTPPSGATFPIGTTTVMCTTTDANGATTTSSFAVTVTNVQLPPTGGDSRSPFTLAGGLVVAGIALRSIRRLGRSH